MHIAIKNDWTEETVWGLDQSLFRQENSIFTVSAPADRIQQGEDLVRGRGQVSLVLTKVR
jgi:hypothetical protein